jgi:hypothetical protein
MGLGARAAVAKNPEEPETAPRAGSDITFIDHDKQDPYWLGAEINFISQYHPSFHADYSAGPDPDHPERGHSLSPDAEHATSGLATVFLAYRPFRTTELILDPEIALGSGFSGATGVAGFPNLDVVRNPTLGHAPYIARAQIHQMIPLAGPWEPDEDHGPISSAILVPRHRLELRFGKMSTADLFDINPVASDSHMQFMNWTVDNNGAFDYAADTRGYTYGLTVEYEGPYLEVRLGEMLMPKVANGLDLETDITKSRGENLEIEIKYRHDKSSAGTLRVLGYINHANMGNYDAAIAQAIGSGEQPDITCTRPVRPDYCTAPPTIDSGSRRTKKGFGLNWYQELGPYVRAFARIGWNDGHNESFAYTEVDNTFSVGGDLRGNLWRRSNDKVGLAFVSNGISSEHAEYLRLGGHGFLLGDGGLDYARETITELYYNAQLWKGIFWAEDIQLIQNPGYNAARGPVWVFSFRAHFEF